MLQYIYGQRKDDGGVLLCCDWVEGLQVSQLESRGWLGNYQGGFFQSPGGVHLSLCSNDLKHRQTIIISTIVPSQHPFFCTVRVHQEQILIKSSTALFTFALASRLASASAAMALCSCWGNFTSLISTRSTLIPHGSVASSRDSCRGLLNT